MKAKLIEKFVSIYGEGGEIRSFFSPGRVNLIGEHTDYNGGHVFPCALSIGTYMIVRKREDRTIRFYSENFSKLGVIETSLDDLVYSEKDGKVLLDNRKEEVVEEETHDGFDITQYTFADFFKMANEVDVKDLAFIQEGIDMNLDIAKKGLEKKYAIGIGPCMQKMVLNGTLSNDMVTDVKLTTAAACDFRMSGGNGSVMTYLGSGNQGLETMLPAAVAAKHLQASPEKLLRAELLGMLIIMYMKKHVGRLSPICGATLAGSGSAAAITYMMGGNLEQISGAVQNMMGGVAGMFCDGAKGGCALKLSICAGEAVYAALYAMDNSIVQATDGIISTAVEDTTKNLMKLSHEGLTDVDMKVIEIMQNKK